MKQEGDQGVHSFFHWYLAQSVGVDKNIVIRSFVIENRIQGSFLKMSMPICSLGWSLKQHSFRIYEKH